MLRLVLTFVVGCVGISSFQWFDAPAEVPPGVAGGLARHFPGLKDEEIAERVTEYGQRLEERRVRRNAFMALTERLLDDLANGRCTLAAATDRQFYYCLEQYPEHLVFVLHVERAKHLKTRVAMNLVRNFEPEDDGCPGGARRAAAFTRMECELAELPYEQDEAARRLVH